MSADSLLFVKSHVSAFTRKDGTFVAAHDDKRSASAPKPRTARPKNKAARAYSGSGAGGMEPAAPANADVNEKYWGDTLPDDDNPTYAMRGLESTHLGHIANGKVDAKRLAHKELASRGQDSDGKWVGFDEAKKHHDALKGEDKPHPSNARVAEHLQSVSSDILSSAAKGHIDLKKRADAELDNRNHDRSGNWIKK